MRSDEAVAAKEQLAEYKQFLKDYSVVNKKTKSMHLNPHLHNEICYHKAEVTRQLERVIEWLEHYLQTWKEKQNEEI